MTDNKLNRSAEPRPVGKTKEDQQHNENLLSGYDYTKYPCAITGYTGQDLQRIMIVRYEDAVRTRIGQRGNYKAGLTRLLDGRLLAAVCRPEMDKDKPGNKIHMIYMYRSDDEGLTWEELPETGIIGKESCLTTLPDGAVLMTAQNADFSRSTYRGFWIARSEDAGETWDANLEFWDGYDYPRSLIVEKDGSLLLLRANLEACDGPKAWALPWNLQACRSRDGGRTWTFTEGEVDWAEEDRNLIGEVSAIRLNDGTLIAALRHMIRGKVEDEGYMDTLITRSSDDGKTWSRPMQMTNTADVHVYLTQLSDGRILATYANYHLPYGVCAIVSTDKGLTWDRDSLVQLSLSGDVYVGWPVTLELPDGSLITSYTGTTYIEYPKSDGCTCEVVRWRLSG